MKISKRWLPALVAPAVIATTAFGIPLQANAVDLPDLTPQQVMQLMDGEVSGFSGTVIQTSDLGLPTLELSSMVNQEMVDEMQGKMPDGFEEFVPQLIEQNALTQALELISGTHRIRIYASDAGMRLQILDPMSQRDLIINQNELWIYNDRDATAQTATIESTVTEAEQADFEAKVRTQIEEYAASLQLDLGNPDAVADFLLEKVSGDTVISVGKDHLVAGRTAYQLIAEPKAANSLIDSVVISVDSETGMALKVEVFSVEQKSAVFEIGFESISFETPTASLFEFTPPSGTTVTQLELPTELEAQLETLQMQDWSEADLEQKKAELEAKFADQPQPELIGSGWESVLKLQEIPGQVPMGMLENELFADLMEQTELGKVFSTPAMNVLITNSGEVYIGAVTVEYLLEVAAR